ncbi:MAG: hypothetical protein QXF12_02825 [Candidatus Aenigmatarchaeota archaeon]
MPVYANGLVLNNQYYAYTFKRDKQYSLSISNNYVHIRGPFKTANDIFTNLAALHPSIILAQYDSGYPVEDGYFFIRDRYVNINGYRIRSFSLKDRMGIISVRLNGNFEFRDLSNNIVPMLAFVLEDYIFMVMDSNTTFTDFNTALLALNGTGIVEITPIPTENQSIFTTSSLVPTWYGDTYNLPDQLYIDHRDYYHYHIDFKDYAAQLFRDMESVLQVKVIHHSKRLELASRDMAFVTFKIEYQDKFMHAIYRKRPPVFDTHQFCSGKIQFTFYSSDLLLTRGFINDYHWFEKLSNNVTVVCINKYQNIPNTQGYCATVRWNLDEPEWEIETVLQDVSSDRQYYQFQVNFSAELWYFYVRKRKQAVNIENIFAVLAEPHQDDNDCTNIRRFVSHFRWIITTNSVIFDNPNNVDNIIISNQ